MGKIFYMMGKSSSGKDTIFKEILKKKELNLHQIVLYTTCLLYTSDAADE